MPTFIFFYFYQRRQHHFHTPTCPTHAHNSNQMGMIANQDRATYSDIILNFLYQLHFKQRVIHRSLNEVPPQNQLIMCWKTHKFIYILKPFNFINIKQYLFLYFFFINVREHHFHTLTTNAYAFDKKLMYDRLKSGYNSHISSICVPDNAIFLLVLSLKKGELIMLYQHKKPVI